MADAAQAQGALAPDAVGIGGRRRGVQLAQQIGAGGQKNSDPHGLAVRKPILAACPRHGWKISPC